MKFSGLPVRLTVLLLALCGDAALAERIVILGDSLSDAYNMPREAGWVHRLDQRLGEAHEVIDGSISGDTSAGAVSRIDGLLEAHQPQVLIVILGGNDGLRGLPPSALETNLAELIERGRAAGAKVALMQIRLPPNLGPVYIERFEGVYPSLAERYEITLIPFFLDDLFDRPGMLMDDGIHPTEAAQPKLAAFMEPWVRQLLAE
ncbi:MAG TPA: arylesterase [Wenzhouxiangellaceae bacterium]|nr:arylesterase [Wenzhouxiangellaceae bacterium]